MPVRLPILLALLLLVVPGCQTTPPAEPCVDPLGCVVIGPRDPIKLGVMQTLSGGSAPGGLEQLRTIQLTLAQRGNELLGHNLQLQVEDEHCTAEGGANAALKIVADPQVVAIWGTNCSSAALAAREIVSEAGLVMVSSANTSPVLTSINGQPGAGWMPGYFRTAWNDTEMGKAAAVFAYSKLGVRKAMLVTAGDVYSKGLGEAFEKGFELLGGQTLDRISIDENERDQRPVLEAVALSGAELVFMPLSQPETGSVIVRQARSMPALNQVVFIGGEGLLSDIFIREAGPAGRGVYVLGPSALTNPQDELLREAYKAAFHEYPPSFYYSFTYDAVNLLLDALGRSFVREPDGTLRLGRQALREALYATQGFEGLTGQLSCDRFGDCGLATLNIMQVTAETPDADALRRHVIYTYRTVPQP